MNSKIEENRNAKHTEEPNHSSVSVRPANAAELPAAARLAAQMWDAPVQELEEEFAKLLAEKDAALFTARLESRIIGFAQCQLRHDYVEGTSTSPVGYLEGIFVEKDSRLRGVARALTKACERWAKEQGCEEFASDCELTNADSLRFHQSLGFTEANRIICFTKSL